MKHCYSPVASGAMSHRAFFAFRCRGKTAESRWGHQQRAVRKASKKQRYLNPL
jgi:hypothetical protein